MSGMLRKLVENYGVDVEKTFNTYVSKCNYDGMGDKEFLKDGIDFICRRQEGDEYSEGAMLGFILGSAHCAENMKAICDGQNEGFTEEMTEAADNAIKSFKKMLNPQQLDMFEAVWGSADVPIMSKTRAKHFFMVIVSLAEELFSHKYEEQQGRIITKC